MTLVKVKIDQFSIFKIVNVREDQFVDKRSFILIRSLIRGKELRRA